MPILGANSSGGSRPSAPVIGSATDGGTGTTASVAFTPSTYVGKGSITYTATSSPGSITATGSSPITVTGLTTGTAYTFTVQGTTNYGVTSAVSSASNSITPAVPSSWETIGSALPSTGTVTFSNIPQTYKSLVLRVSYLLNSGSGGSSRLRLNESSAANYSQVYMTSYNTSNGGGFQTGANGWTLDYNSVYGSNATYPTVIEVEFPGYASSTKYRVAYAKYATVSNSPTSASEQGSFAAYWDVTSAISSISWVPSTTCNGDGYVALYGLK